MLGERAHCLAEAWRTLRQLHWCLAESARAWLSILPTIFMVNKDYQYSMVINFYSGLDKYQASTSNCWNCNRYGTTLCLKKIRTPIINMTYLHQFTTFSNYFLTERCYSVLFWGSVLPTYAVFTRWCWLVVHVPRAATLRRAVSSKAWRGRSFKWDNEKLKTLSV